MQSFTRGTTIILFTLSMSVFTGTATGQESAESATGTDSAPMRTDQQCSELLDRIQYGLIATLETQNSALDILTEIEAEIESTINIMT